jgi:cell division topological specificity factor
MGIFSALFSRKSQPSSSDLARERLKVVLVNDRLKLSPAVLEQLKQELLEVISRRLEIDEQGVQIIVTRSDRLDKLIADVPLRRPRMRFEDSAVEPAVKPATGVSSTYRPQEFIQTGAGEAKEREEETQQAPADESHSPLSSPAEKGVTEITAGELHPSVSSPPERGNADMPAQIHL